MIEQKNKGKTEETNPAYQDSSDYRQRVRGCWIGKTMGGGIGAPYEGDPLPHRLTPADLHIDQGPNDDLELQLLWLRLAEQHGLALRSKHFTPVWLEQLGRGFGCDEYGMAVFNLRRGLMPPATGYVDNWFINGMGAAIRAEIWGCLFPGNPAAAGFYAEQDATLDHHGEGVWGEIFLASVVSEAFFCVSASEALERGLRHIPSASRVSQAVRFTRELVGRSDDVCYIRNEIMHAFGSHNFTDCLMNLCFITAALLLGEGDFVRTVLTAVNFGMDTDCTAATCGSLFGLIHGPDSFGLTMPNEHIATSDCLDRSELPANINELTDRTVALAQRLAAERSHHPERICPSPYRPWQPDAATLALSRSTWRIGYTDPDAEETSASSSGLPVELPGFHTDLSGYCCNFATLYLTTFLTVPVELDNAQLLFCASTGITVWLDGRMVLNYHGRQQPLPAFHRTEGGGVVYQRLEKGRRYAVKVRLLFGHSPLKFSFAAGDEKYHLVPGAQWNCN